MYAGFPAALIPALRCSADGGELSYAGHDTHVREGELVCASCSARYEVRDGIALFLEQEKLEPFLKHEMHERDSYAHKYEKHFTDRFHREMVPTQKCVGPLTGKAVIEYGAGTGRFTELLAKESRLYLASDMSLESLRILAQKDIPDTVGLVCAESASFKTANGFFDVAVALQLIEHMPHRPMRDTFYATVYDTLTTRGFFVASVYHQNMRRILKRMSKDGAHPNGISYHFFSVQEFCKELQSHFKKVTGHPIDITLPLEKRFGFSSETEGEISQALEHVPVLNMFGHLVLAKASKSL